MSAGPYRACEIELEFADADYLFRLPLKRIGELEERCGAPIGAIWKRVCLTGEFHANDLIETVRLGLIGGGLDPQAARKLIERYCDEWPLQVWHSHAIAVLGACVEGYEPEPDAGAGADAADESGEAAAGKKPEAAGEAISTSPPATPSGSKRASRRKLSES